MRDYENFHAETRTTEVEGLAVVKQVNVDLPAVIIVESGAVFGVFFAGHVLHDTFIP